MCLIINSFMYNDNNKYEFIIDAADPIKKANHNSGRLTTIPNMTTITVNRKDVLKTLFISLGYNFKHINS